MLCYVTPVTSPLCCAICISQRIVFKTVMLVYKCLRGLTLSYISVFYRPVSTLPGRRQLSGITSILHVPRTMTSIGSRSFADAGPVTLNSLTENSRTVRSVFCQTFGDLSLQQLLTAACTAFVVTSYLMCALYKCPYYNLYYYHYYYYYYAALHTLVVVN